MQKLRETVFFNGRFISIEKAKISALTPGVLCGWGLFETMRSYNNKIVHISQHLKRIKDSSKLIDLKFTYSIGELRGAIKKLVKINGFKDSYVRLTLWKSDSGVDTLLLAKKYHPYQAMKYKQGFRICISEFKQNPDSYLSRLKTTGRLLYQLSFKKAKDRGFDEAVILNERGFICEGTRSNLFFVKDKIIFTPALSCGCLDGITRKAVFNLAKINKLKIFEGNFALQDLYSANEAFLTNSLMGIMPLSVIEKQRIANGARNFKLTRFFIRKYKELLKDES